MIGREFPVALVTQVVDKPDDEVQQTLSNLQLAEFIYEQPAAGDIEYIFKHALTQEVAYNSVLMERRKLFHERAAKALEEFYRAKIDDHYSELAHHYQRSGNSKKAIDYLRLAGIQAVQRSANTEAIGYLNTGLELLKSIPETPELAHQELMLHAIAGPALMAAQGYAAPEVEEAAPERANCVNR